MDIEGYFPFIRLNIKRESQKLRRKIDFSWQHRHCVWRRCFLQITEDLRQEVIGMFREMHQYFDRKYAPKVKYSKACNACSLRDICLPKLGKSGSVRRYITQMLKEEEE